VVSAGAVAATWRHRAGDSGDVTLRPSSSLNWLARSFSISAANWVALTVTSSARFNAPSTVLR
jgi:hypothetical protein